MDATPTRRSSKIPFLLFVVLVLYALWGPLPNSADVARHRVWKAVTFAFPDNAKGTVEAHGKTIGDYASTIDSCRSGERKQFYGISFWNYEHPEYAGRIALPENDQPHVSMDALMVDAKGNGYGIPFYQDECSVWDVDLHHTSSTYNGIWAMAGHARFDCFHQDTGAHVKDDLKFWSCH